MKHLKFLIFSLAFTALLFSCETETDPCDGITCMNGGECVEGDCDCPDGYSGTNCEIHPCDASDHIVSAWTITSYSDVRYNLSDVETSRSEGSSGTMTFNADNSGALMVNLSSSSFNDAFTYTNPTVSSDGTRETSVNYGNFGSTEYVFQTCDQNSFSIQADFTEGSTRYVETIMVTR